MIRLPTFDGASEAVAATIRDVLDHGEVVSPRGLTTFETRDVGFRIVDIRRRVIGIPERRWSLPLAAAELIWHRAARRDVASLARLAPQWSRFADESGLVSASCYGARIFSSGEDGVSAWDRAAHVLQKDPDTRRAMIGLADGPATDLWGSNDVSCASSLHFMIREGRLDLTVHMRSNDVMLGLPYDVFTFTALQELMAFKLNVPVGLYTHLANSMHLYERDLRRARRIAEAAVVELPQMSEIDRDVSPLVIGSFLDLGQPSVEDPLATLGQFWGQLALIVRSGSQVGITSHRARVAGVSDPALLAALK